MKRKIHHIIKKHTSHVVQHIKKHKHHYMLGVFGSFAIIKTIGLFIGLFGFLTIKSTLAGYNDGLVGYWSLDTNANDYISNNNGTAFNINTVVGKIHNAYDFNGLNSYIDIPNSNTLNITGTITIQAWIKRDSNPLLGARRASIVNKGGDNQYRLQHSSTNTGFEFAIRTISGTSFAASTTTPQEGVWYFLVGTYDGSTIKLYVNGILERSVSRTSPIMSSISPVNIGRRATINDRYFNGIIDEVAIWNRALSSVEIAGLYNGGEGLSLAPVTTYTLTYSSDANGTVSGEASQIINEGNDGTPITAIPNSGYHFLERSDSSTNNPRTDTNVTGNISVTAEFEINTINTYNLSYTAGSNGILSGNNSQTVNEGSNGSSVTAIPNAGYHFTQWNDGNTSNPRTDTNITGNISVTAQFAINSSTTYDNGLILYLPFDSDMQDYSSNNNHGVGIGEIGSIGGKVGGAYDFVGEEKYISVTDNETLRMIGSSYTLSSWIYMTNEQSEAGIISKGMYPSSGPGYGFMISNTNPGSISGNPPGEWFYSSNPIQLNDWQLITVSFDASTNNHAIYINGNLNTETVNGGKAPIDDSADLWIGNWREGDYDFEGYIDEVAIWNRALSSNEISGLYNNGNGISLMDDAPITYTLSYTTDGNGTISGTASQTINEGENGTTVTAIPNFGYHFLQWSDGSTSNPRTDTNVTGNITVTAQFETVSSNTYTLSYSAGDHGTLSGNNSQTINEGEDGTAVRAVANAGYHFTQWSDGSTSNPRTDTNVTGNISVTAQFAINSSTTYDNGLILYLPFDSDMQDYSSNNNHGVGIGEIGSIGGKVGGAYDFGGGEKYVSVADNEALRMIGFSYTLSAWIYMTSEKGEAGIVSKGNYPSSGPGYGFMIIGTNPAGISGNPPGNWFNSSYSVPISDWRLITVTFDSSTNNHAIYVNGSLDTETVNGGRAPIDDAADLWIGNWREGNYDFEGYIDEVAIWNRALSSNEISGLYNNGNGISLMDNPINTYTLTYTANSNGTISGTTSQTINEGENGTTVTAIPNSGYHFLQWSDGSTNNPRTDTNVTGNISVTAQFEINSSSTYTLNYLSDANGTLSGNNSQTVNEGSNGSPVTAIPNSGYHFLQRSDSSTSNPRTDTNVTGNISVTAIFSVKGKETNGGGHQSIIKDNCPSGDNSISYYDNICDIKSITGENTHGTAPIKSSTKTITRKTLARLLVFFSEEVLHIQPKENNTCTFEDIRNESTDNQLIIKKSCQLGLMGLQKDGLTVDHKFRGNDTVMYEEFITTISRLLYDKKNNISLNVATDGFANHIKALDNDNILVEIPERITQSVVVNILKKIYENPNMIKK